VNLENIDLKEYGRLCHKVVDEKIIKNIKNLL